MSPIVSIKAFDDYGEGWSWTVAFTPWPEDRRVIHTCRTNRAGRGIWFFIKSRRDWMQSEGTLQFSLPADRKKARAKVYRYYRGLAEGPKEGRL